MNLLPPGVFLVLVIESEECLGIEYNTQSIRLCDTATYHLVLFQTTLRKTLRDGLKISFTALETNLA